MSPHRHSCRAAEVLIQMLSVFNQILQFSDKDSNVQTLRPPRLCPLLLKTCFFSFASWIKVFVKVKVKTVIQVIINSPSSGITVVTSVGKIILNMIFPADIFLTSHFCILVLCLNKKMDLTSLLLSFKMPQHELLPQNKEVAITVINPPYWHTASYHKNIDLIIIQNRMILTSHGQKKPHSETNMCKKDKQRVQLL